jgi:translation elongation factor P/translation initiation factor 5A
MIEPGEAGGVIEDTFTASATVAAVDPATRKITLTSEDGNKATFTVPAEAHNFDQIHVGDKVNATIVERMVVFVRSATTEPTVTHAAAVARAPKGAKPGALIAESFEIVAAVKAIDADKRTATLQFSDGQTKVVPVRKDVDLSRYKVGDSVVIRVTEALALLVQKP